MATYNPPAPVAYTAAVRVPTPPTMTGGGGGGDSPRPPEGQLWPRRG